MDTKPLCPSSTSTPGAILLGVVLEDGSVGFLEDRLVIDQDFVDRAKQGRRPEQRFRFSSPCAQGACHQWTGSRCGVIDHVLELASDSQMMLPMMDALPACSIRSDCRWFSQSGAEACRVCLLVITDTREDAVGMIAP
jgi:hypothetical protein